MEVAVDFIGADVMKAKGLTARCIEARPIGSSGFEQSVSAGDIGVNKLTGSIDGAINM